MEARLSNARAATAVLRQERDGLLSAVEPLRRFVPSLGSAELRARLHAEKARRQELEGEVQRVRLLLEQIGGRVARLQEAPSPVRTRPPGAPLAKAFGGAGAGGRGAGGGGSVETMADQSAKIAKEMVAKFSS